MNLRTLILTIILLTIIGFVAAWRVTVARTVPVDRGDRAPVNVGQTDPLTAPSTPAPSPSRTTTPPPSPPLQWAGFWAWDTAKQAELATTLQYQRTWDPYTRAWVLAAIHRKELAPIVRNNLSNGLVAQESPEPDLDQYFGAMADDPDEDPVWREYAVQFLGLTPQLGADGGNVTDRLFTIADRQEYSVAGTALIQIHRVDEAAGTRGPLAQAGRTMRLNEQLHRLAFTPGPDVPSRMAALGLIGARGMTAHAPALRELIAHPGDRGVAGAADILRCAIAALARVGDASDRELIAPYGKDSNGAVVLAATAALERLARGESSATRGESSATRSISE